MSDYRKIAEQALLKSLNRNKPKLNEGVVYGDNISERMHPQLEQELAERKHSLGKHPAIPEGDENNFEQTIMGKRFSEVVNRYKRAFDVEDIDNTQLMMQMMPMVHETMALESKHKKDLEKLAEKMIREEYDMSEDVVEIKATLSPKISLEGTKKHPTPKSNDYQFESHSDMVNAKEEVYKRRLLNAMIQGSAKKTNHMFHVVDEELTNMDPRLLNRYSKVMSAADYMYYVIPKMDNGTSGGVVKVTFPTPENPKAVIEAEAMIFPVLIHELVKGVMELLSAHGLPKDKKLGDYVVDKADFLAAEPWDMRIGPALWDRFTDSIDGDDFSLKHHLYTELASLPVNEFNEKMREIFAGTNTGKKIVKEIMDNVKRELKEDDFNEAMNELNTREDKDYFTLDEIMFGDDIELDEDDDDVFNSNDLF
jgi:uncharacterized protein YutD